MRTRRVRYKQSYEYSDTLDSVIVSLCRDYERRDHVVKEGGCSERTAMEYRYLNYRILEGVKEIVGETYAPIFIEEIGRRTGFAYTDVGYLSESAYKTAKQDVKLSIARKLHLFD